MPTSSRRVARWRLFFTREVVGVVCAMISVAALIVLCYQAMLISGVWTGL
ncbi:hypothetical protein AA101099_2945 [Neoasaia chiangmaiensis NBRC 101099]|nr:hypothetical protein [Neoasaia chiangmaiensis]GBR42665.1 hypothetical protein AA101099_2945 [Neoasaia chiangmaiensis NBRC 101099]GEN16234.1 hypothetical protein NCH01_26650 [Neoasaia chiangmaiensis]